LTHLKQLEVENIYIIREVAAEFEKPVMPYSIGKDSTVMLQLALKAFFPGKPPFPLLHVEGFNLSVSLLNEPAALFPLVHSFDYLIFSGCIIALGVSVPPLSAALLR
jgi:hypothetical protein